MARRFSKIQSSGGLLCQGAAGTIGAIGDNARGYAKASAGSEHNVGVPSTSNDGKVGREDRAKSSIIVRILGIVTLAAALIATVLVFLGVTDIAIAGDALALIPSIAAAIPLIRD